MELAAESQIEFGSETKRAFSAIHRCGNRVIILKVLKARSVKAQYEMLGIRPD
jgi:hypothetical protein